VYIIVPQALFIIIVKYFSLRMKYTGTLIILLVIFVLPARAQKDIMIRGYVYDSTRMLTIPQVKVTSTSGSIAYTDSVGYYNILVSPGDSISFFFRGKSTAQFPVKDIRYQQGFDVSLRVTIQSRYQTLKEVIVIGKSYRQDSLENREKYRKAFGYDRGLSLSETNPVMGGTPGLDPNSIINMFRFRRNKSMQRLQSRLLEEEAQKFIDYRFNKSTVKHLTGLEGEELVRFMEIYRPDYEFTAYSTEYEFYQYILDASKRFRRGLMPQSINRNN
jgi:hypothetical protein